MIMERLNLPAFRQLSMCLLVCFFVAVSGVLDGQTITLNDVVGQALSNYPLLRQRKAEVAMDAAHVTTVQGNRLPGLLLQQQLNAGSDNPVYGAYFSMGLVPSTPGSYNTLHSAPIAGAVCLATLKWEFCNFGYYKAQGKEANARLQAGQALMEADKYQVKVKVVTLYFEWLKQYRLMLIAADNVARANVILVSIRANVNSGLKPGVDSSIASSSLANAKIGYLQALNSYNSGRIGLSGFTGTTYGEAMPDTSLLRNDAGVNGGYTIPDSRLVPEVHPILNQYRSLVDLQLASNKTISAKYMPKLGLNFTDWVRNTSISPLGVYPDNLTFSFPYSRNNYLAGLNFTYNLADLKHRHDELAEGKLAAEAKQEALKGEQQSLDVLLAQVNAAYSSTMEQLREIPVQLQSARQAYGQQMALYSAGLNTLIEVTNAQYLLQQAETNYVIAEDDVLQLSFMKAALTGQPDIFLQRLKQ